MTAEVQATTPRGHDIDEPGRPLIAACAPDASKPAGLAVNDETLLRAQAGPEPISVLLVGFGSPEHYNLWNNLSIAALKGDLFGHFGSEVAVRLSCVRHEKEVDELVGRLARSPLPDWIGLSVQPGSLVLVGRFVEGLRGLPCYDRERRTLVFGNQVPTYHPEAMLEICPEAVVVRGEGELSLRGLVQHKQGLTALEEVPNLVFRRSEHSVVHTPVGTSDLSHLVHAPDTGGYEEVLRRGGNVMVQTSRGCPWGGCLYCTRTSFRRGGEVIERGSASSWAALPLTRVLADIGNAFRAARAVGQKNVEFEIADDEFFGGRTEAHRERVEAIAEGIERLKAEHDVRDFSFRLFTRPDILFRESDRDGQNGAMAALLRRLQEVGLVQVFVGVEGGTEEQLRWYRRGTTMKETLAALDLLEALGLGVDIGFIMFYPDLTLPQMLENVRLYRSRRLMRYNQWPFRPMVVNEGSRACRKLGRDGLLWGANPDFLSFGYTCRDPDVAWIQRIVDELSPVTRTVMYALKVKSKKYFDPRKKDRETFRCQAHVERSGYIFLDLMEELAVARLTGSAETSSADSVNRAKERMLVQLRAIDDDLRTGLISDDDFFLRRELPSALELADCARPEVRGDRKGFVLNFEGFRASL